MSGQSMADVLAGHEMENSPVIRGEGYTRCSCGFLSKGAYSRAAHNRHVADSLSAAGFGPVQEAKADAWEECEAAPYEIRLNTGSNSWGAVKDNPYRKDQP